VSPSTAVAGTATVPRIHRPTPRWLLYAYFLRTQIVTVIVLVVLPIAALHGRAAPLLNGLFDINYETRWLEALAMFITGYVVVTLGGAIATTTWTTIVNAPQRFEVDVWPALPEFVPRWANVAAVLPGAVSIVAAIRHSWSASGVPPAHLIVGALGGGVMAFLPIEYARKHFANSPEPGAFMKWLSRHPNVGAGYVKPDGAIRPGHRIAAAAFGLTLLLYIAVGFGKFLRIGEPAVVPTIAAVLLLLMLGCWVVSACTFFFDRYRVPVFSPLLLLPIATSFAAWSDHFYRTEPHQPRWSPRPGEALGLSNGPIIVVAADGGGIQAAAWSAQVLTGLTAQLHRELGADRFGPSVRLISSVSGGGIGAMYFVNQYQNGHPAGDLSKVVRNAEASSLDDVAWGAAYPDTLRTVLPVFWSDRGQALEWAWKRDGGVATRLADWRADVWNGKRPSNIFNATIVDSGERLLMGTSMLTSGVGRRNFEELYDRADLEVVTAARLSAGFTYVSPAARSDLPASVPYASLHIVDGGYYDNYGMSTLMEWLHEGLLELWPRPGRVLVVQIRSAPPSEALVAGDERGWFYQAWAPLAAMLHVRTTGQLSHNREEFQRLQELWGRYGVEIDNAVFQFCGSNPPLSWHMTARERAAITAQWDREVAQPAGLDVVRRFLKGEPVPNTPAWVSCGQ
jgi:patatin-like phospholipase